ncbi:hypothetical protein pb186bvf_013596 [Paramecium bursaria]
MNNDQFFQYKPFQGNLETFSCSICLDICKDPVVDKNTMQIACKHHLCLNQRGEIGIILRNLFTQIQLNCYICKKLKNYYKYFRHKQKCYERLLNSNEILNSFVFYQIQDKDKFTCQLCGNLDIAIFICTGCSKQKCIRCGKNSKQRQCKMFKKEQFFQNKYNCQLKCKAIFCSKQTTIGNSLTHYKQCKYRMKNCRCPKCNWSGFNFEYKSHECIREKEKVLNQALECEVNQKIELQKNNQLFRIFKANQKKINILQIRKSLLEKY